MFKTIGWRIGIGFALSLVALFIVGLVAYRSLDALIEASHKVTQANEIKSALAELMSEMKDAETGQRGFVITADESYLDPYNGALTAVPRTLADLRGMLAKDPTANERLDQAEALANQKLAELKEVIDTRRAQPTFEAAQKIVLTGRGKATMDQMRVLVNKMDQDQTDLLKHEAEAVAEATVNAESTIVWGTIIGALVVAVVGTFIVTNLNAQLGGAVRDMESSSAELQASSQQQATGAKEQATAMSEISTTITELLATSRQIDESAQRVAQIAAKTAMSARTGDTTVQQARDSMGGIQRQVDLIVSHMLDLGKKSQQIGGVLELINELAEQTNILAINATIEAAGAGDAGRRFAVVADEIRKLADRVGGSTKEIRVLIDEVRSAVNTTVMVTEAGSKAVDAGSRQVGDAAASFTAIASLVDTTTEAAQEISLSTKQQTTAVEQVKSAVTNVAQTTKENEASTAQTLQTALQLASLARTLSRLIRA
jgi:methyl-accepting chemotaxis protein